MIRFLSRYATTRGIFGGSRVWAVVAVATWAVRLLRRSGARDAHPVYSEVLRPGEVLEIRHHPGR